MILILAAALVTYVVTVVATWSALGPLALAAGTLGASAVAALTGAYLLVIRSRGPRPERHDGPLGNGHANGSPTA